jgi:sigma-E factor negative regulatory protein RseA
MVPRDRWGADAMNKRLSAWMDGELESEQACQLPSQLKNSVALRAKWDCYHLIGDTLRGVLGPDLCARVCACLEVEPTVLTPQRHGVAELLHWRPMQVAASIAAAVFVGWMALPAVQQEVPQTTTIPVPELKQVAMRAGENVNDYLLAHQRYSPSNAMYGVAPYVRTVAQQRRADAW